MQVQVNDWTGSSEQRREQRGCLDYGSYPEDNAPSYQIDKGSLVLVKRRFGKRRWKPIVNF